MTSFYGFFILFLQFLQFFLIFFCFSSYNSFTSLYFSSFFFLPHACLYSFIVLCHMWLVTPDFSLAFLEVHAFYVSIITSLYAFHHFSEPTLYICPYFLQVFLLLLCFSVFVFCFVIKYSQFCIFPLRVLEDTLHFSLCFFLLFPLFLFSASVLLCSASSNITCNPSSFFPHVLELTLRYSVYFLLLFLLFVHFCILCSAFFQAPSLTRSLFTV